SREATMLGNRNVLVGGRRRQVRVANASEDTEQNGPNPLLSLFRTVCVPGLFKVESIRDVSGKHGPYFADSLNEPQSCIIAKYKSRAPAAVLPGAALTGWRSKNRLVSDSLVMSDVLQFDLPEEPHQLPRLRLTGQEVPMRGKGDSLAGYIRDAVCRWYSSAFELDKSVSNVLLHADLKDPIEPDIPAGRSCQLKHTRFWLTNYLRTP